MTFKEYRENLIKNLEKIADKENTSSSVIYTIERNKDKVKFDISNTLVGVSVYNQRITKAHITMDESFYDSGLGFIILDTIDRLILGA